ncbi:MULTISPECIES: ABC transporter substrate-binding protein [unclassified Modestobacter]
MPTSPAGTLPGLFWDRLYAVYGALITVDVDGQVQPGLAESLESDDDGATWTLTLREGLTFTDGEPLDAAAVKYNWDLIAGSDLAGADIAGSFTSEVVDDTTLRLTVAEPDPILDLRIAETIPFVASPAALEAQGENYTDPVGAGPFVLESTDPAIGETLTANEDYWSEDEPHLETLNLSIISDPAQRIQTVIQGGADIMNGYPFQWADQADNPAVDTYSVTSGGIRSYVFNTTAEPFSDVRARQAAAMVIDPTELLQTLTQDASAEGTTTLFPETSPFYDESLTLPEGGLEEAQALIDEVAADGVSMDVTILIPQAPENVRVGEFIGSALRQLEGLNVTVEQVALGDWRTAAGANDDFDITPYPGVFDLASPQIAMGNLFDPAGTESFSNFDSPEMAAALDAAQNAASDEELADAMAEIQRIYVEQVPIAVFGADERAFLHRTEVGGLEAMGRGALYLDRLFVTE